jgi:hypothetical protein
LEPTAISVSLYDLIITKVYIYTRGLQTKLEPTAISVSLYDLKITKIYIHKRPPNKVGTYSKFSKPV